MEFVSKILFFFGAIGVFNSFLVSAYFLISYSYNSKANRIFGLFLLVLSLRVLKSLFYSFSTEEPIFFLQSGPSFFLLIGPLFFSYIINVVKPKIGIAKYWKLHVIIWLLIVVVLILVFPFSSNLVWNKTTLLPLVSLQWISYILLSTYFLKTSKSNYHNMSLLIKWLVLITLSMLILWSVLFFASFDFFISGSIVFSILFYCFFLYFIFNKKSAFQVFKKSNQGTSIDINKNNELVASLSSLMKDEKPYKDSSLKSIEVASDLDISLHEFSRLLNEVIGKSFSDFINEYRVEEAKHLITSNSKYTLEAIGNMSGFNSKSAFYKAFKKFTGVTPAKYKV